MGLFLVLALGAQAQNADWNEVRNLPPGSRISVKTRFRVLCDFDWATDDELVCEPVSYSPFYRGPTELLFDRKRVREVRLEHSDETNSAIGAAVGGGTGAIIGAVGHSDTITRGGGALLLGGIGSLIGGSFNKEFPITHGKVVYKR